MSGLSYIFCLGEDGAASRTAQADQTYHPDEIQRSNGRLGIEYQFFLAQQLFLGPNSKFNLDSGVPTPTYKGLYIILHEGNLW